jgi:hypothetical protein
MDDNAKRGRGAARELTALGVLWRFVGTLFLVLITYNPSRYSFVDWVWTAESLGPQHFLAGVVLLIGWVILLAATKNSLNTFGMVLGILLLGGLVWLMIDFGLLSLDSVSSLTWVILICVAALLTIGLCWSHIWRRLTGQFEVDTN